MFHTARIRFWIEAVLAVLTAALFVLTIFSREWIEVVFGVDPDRGSGALEWAIVAILFIATVTLTVTARVEWKRRASAAA